MHINVTAICQFYWEHFFCEKINLIFLEVEEAIFFWREKIQFLLVGTLVICTFVMRRVHWKIHSERHQTHPGTTYPPPPPPPPQSQPDHHHHQVSLVRQILERRLQNKKDVQTRERVNMCHPKNWNPSHSTYRKLKTGIFCPSKMCNWERFSRKLSCWSSVHCAGEVSGPDEWAGLVYQQIGASGGRAC